MPMIATTASMSVLGFGGLGHQATGSPGINTAWLARIGNFGNTGFNTTNISTQVAVDPATGDFYIVGKDNGVVSNGGHAIMKIKSTGSVEWQKIVGAFQGFCHAQDCCVDSAGDLYWVGTSYGTPNQPTGYAGGGTQDVLFGKYTKTGTLAFAKRMNSTFGSGGIEFGEGIAYSASDNTVVITGKGSRYISSSLIANQCFVAKFYTDGTLAWKYWYSPISSTNAFYGKGISIDTSGNIYISVYSVINNIGNTLLALDSSGGIRWAYRLKINNASAAQMVPYRTVTTSAGNVAMAISGSATVTTSKYFIVVGMYNSGGGLIWTKAVDKNRASTSQLPLITDTGPGTPLTSGPNNLMGIAADSSGNIYVATNGRSNTTADCILLYKFAAANGAVLWVRAIYINTGSIQTVPTGLTCLGNFLYLVGTTYFETTTISNYGNYLFAKLPIDGTAISAIGYTVDTGISYLNTDVGSFHPEITLPSGIVNEYIAGDVSKNATTAYDGLTDTSALTQYTNTMTLQSKLISVR